MRIHTNKITHEDKFNRKYACTVTGYRIIAKGKHISLNETLCTIQSMTDDSVYIIDEKGIEKI